MTLKGKQPDEVKKRLKMFMYGGAGVGKTTAAISFPNVYLIDTERGAENSQYLDLLKKNHGALFQTNDFKEILAEVKALLTEKHDYKTLVIDPLTTVYNNLVDRAARDPYKKDPTAFGAHYGVANKEIKNLLSMLLRLDMNVIITSHAKNEYGDNMAIVGQTYDCYKKLDYLFDLVLEIRKLGTRRTAVVKKTRIATFEESEEFEFSYDNVANKYGRDVMEATSANVQLATPQQLKDIKHYCEILKISEEVIDKWFTKADVDRWEDMPAELMDKCIRTLIEKIENKGGKS